MDLLPSPEQQEIIDATAAFAEGELPLSRLHESDAPTPLGRELWGAMAELGWFGLAIAEADGGVGFTLAEEALVFRELGRVLAPSNMLAAAIAARVALQSGATALAASIIAGDQRVAFAQAVESGAQAGEQVSGPFYRIEASDVELLLCATASGFAVVEEDAFGSSTSIPCIDEHTHLAKVSTDRVAALAHASSDGLRDRTAVLVAAMLSGAAEATRDQAAAYACERKQFGKPIGAFQAVKHKCADMAVRCEAATWQTLYAALVVRSGDPAGALQASAAKALAAEAAVENGRANILVHGGYGVTSEYDAHLFLKRAHLLDLLGGGRSEHLVRILEQPAAA